METRIFSREDTLVDTNNLCIPPSFARQVERQQTLVIKTLSIVVSFVIATYFRILSGCSTTLAATHECTSYFIDSCNNARFARSSKTALRANCFTIFFNEDCP